MDFAGRKWQIVLALTMNERRTIPATRTTKEILECDCVAFNLRPVNSTGIPSGHLRHFRTSRSGRPRSAFNQKAISTLGGAPTGNP
jgi:hypothetical protein